MANTPASDPLDPLGAGASKRAASISLPQETETAASAPSGNGAANGEDATYNAQSIEKTPPTGRAFDKQTIHRRGEP